MASRGVNKVILVGNLGQGPEMRYMPNGGAVANITLATSESWRDKQTGESKEVTEWHRVVLFGKLAEVAGKYLRKGSQVYMAGLGWTGQIHHGSRGERWRHHADAGRAWQWRRRTDRTAVQRAAKRSASAAACSKR